MIRCVEALVVRNVVAYGLVISGGRRRGKKSVRLPIREVNAHVVVDQSVAIDHDTGCVWAVIAVWTSPVAWSSQYDHAARGRTIAWKSDIGIPGNSVSHHGRRGAVTDLDAVHGDEAYVPIASHDVIADLDMSALAVSNDAAFLVPPDLVTIDLASGG